MFVIGQWRAIAAIGKITAMDLVASRPKCRPVEMLLQSATWEGTRLRIDIMHLDRDVISKSLQLSDVDWAALAAADFHWPAMQWWEWSDENDILNHPGWWDNPESSLVRTSLLICSDK